MKRRGFTRMKKGPKSVNPTDNAAPNATCEIRRLHICRLPRNRRKAFATPRDLCQIHYDGRGRKWHMAKKGVPRYQRRHNAKEAWDRPFWRNISTRKKIKRPSSVRYPQKTTEPASRVTLPAPLVNTCVGVFLWVCHTDIRAMRQCVHNIPNRLLGCVQLLGAPYMTRILCRCKATEKISHQDSSPQASYPHDSDCDPSKRLIAPVLLE